MFDIEKEREVHYSSISLESKITTLKDLVISIITVLCIIFIAIVIIYIFWEINTIRLLIVSFFSSIAISFILGIYLVNINEKVHRSYERILSYMLFAQIFLFFMSFFFLKFIDNLVFV